MHLFPPDQRHKNRHQIGCSFRTGPNVVDRSAAPISASDARISTSGARDSTYNVRALVRLFLPNPMPSSTAAGAIAAPHVLPPMAKLHRCVVLMDGLFKGAVKSDKGHRPQVERVKEFDNGNALARYIGPQLGADDLRLLQAALTLATIAPRTGTGGKASPQPPMKVQCTLEALGYAAGYKAAGSGAVNKVLLNSLARFAQGKFAWESTSALSVEGQPLIAQEEPDASLPRRRGLTHGTGRATRQLTLHPLLAVAIRAGRAKTHFLQLDMNEVRQLSSDATRLLHHRLCHLNLGEEAEHGIDKLVSYVAGQETGNLSRHQWRHDQAKVAAALEELAKLGWTVSDAGNSQQGIQKKLIRRPKMLAAPKVGVPAGANAYGDADLI